MNIQIDINFETKQTPDMEISYKFKYIDLSNTSEKELIIYVHNGEFSQFYFEFPIRKSHL